MFKGDFIMNGVLDLYCAYMQHISFCDLVYGFLEDNFFRSVIIYLVQVWKNS